MEFGSITEGKHYWVTLQDKGDRTVAFGAPSDVNVLDVENTDPIKPVVDFFLELGALDDSGVQKLLARYQVTVTADEPE